MKTRNADGKISPDDLLKQIKTLQHQLFEADVQFALYEKLRKTLPDYKEEYYCSPVFWTFTQFAHITMVALRLSRIYDTDGRSFSLPAFLKTIEANGHLFNKKAFMERNADNPNLNRLLRYPKEINSMRLTEHQNMCSDANPTVKKLLINRHNLLAHTSLEVYSTGEKAFQQKFPLSGRDIKTLIENGFLIVDGYAQLFGAPHSPSQKGTDYPFDDFLPIFDAVRKSCKGQ